MLLWQRYRRAAEVMLWGKVSLSIICIADDIRCVCLYMCMYVCMCMCLCVCFFFVSMCVWRGGGLSKMSCIHYRMTSC
jgi:hypothetical protein